MLLNGATSVQSTNLTQSKDSNLKKNKSVSSDKTKLNGDTVSLKTIEIVDMIKKYDIKSINSQDLLDFGNKLFEEGILSFEEHAFLTLMPKLELDPHWGNSLNLQANVPKNVMKHWQNLYESQKKKGASGIILNNTKMMVAFLENYDEVRDNLMR